MFQLSPQTQSRSRPEPTVRYRASKACRRCNEKRVKCDASERGTPCTRCEDRNEPNCSLIQSRRGIYVRKPRQRPRRSGTIDPENDGNVGSQPTTTPPSPEPQRQQDTPNNASSIGLVHGERSPADLGGDDEPQDGHLSADLDRAHTVPSFSNVLPEHGTPSGNTEVSNASSYREISWGAMFDHLFEGQHTGEDVVDKCSITYLGETFPLAIVLKDLKGGRGRPRLHHPGPPCPRNEELPEPQGLHHPSYMGPEEIAFLEAKKAFEAPSSETLDALISVFLDRVFPIYPIVNRQEFLEQYSSRRIPWILLHALCFTTATFCPADILHRGGFESRRQARWIFYSKAKALFDVGYEGNKIVVLQVAILMSFWGGGPNNYWNFYSWISTGVTIAETLGCHRSMAGTNIKPRDRSLLKRLWWVLVVRDTQCAALVGRPFRINLDHCDTDALTPEDFEHDGASPGFTTGPYTHRSSLYQIQVMKLTLILRQIIVDRFYPMREKLPPPSLPPMQMLTEWRAQLPPQLQWSDNAAHYSNVFTSTLCVLYNHHIILAHLPCPLDSVQPSSADTYPKQQPYAEAILSGAAQKIASTACAVATKSEIFMAPHELFHGIFIAAVVFYMQTKNLSKPMMAQLGASGLANCQMLLHESRESWDPSPWIMQLFDKVLFCSPPSGHSPSHHRSGSEEEAFHHQSMPTFVEGAGTGGTGGLDEHAIFPANYGMWQSHIVLGNLFDMSQTNSLMPMTPGFDDRPGPTPWS